MSDFNPLANAKIPTHRSGFDLSQKRLFTAKVGEILPVYWQIAIPGSKYRISADSFTRTVPVNTAAYTRIKEYYDFFAVPLRLISRALPQAFTQMTDYQTSAMSSTQNTAILKDVPYTTLLDIGQELSGMMTGPYATDDAGLPSTGGAIKLLQYLGYGSVLPSTMQDRSQISAKYCVALGTAEDKDNPLLYVNNLSVNLLPLAAYHKIYYDFFSNSQWERHLAFTYNFDWWDGVSPIQTFDSRMFILHYANYPKDWIFGVLPNSQFGNVALLQPRFNSTLDSNIIVAPDNPDVTAGASSLYIPAGSIAAGVGSTTGSARNVMLNANLSALSIRATEYLQRWKEIVQFSSKDYTDQIEAQFGIHAPEYMGNHCHYIGGWNSVISINEVINQNLDTNDSQASIAGKGVGSNSGHSIEYTVGAEHCVIMCVYHSMPLVDWDLSGQSPQLTIHSIEDFPQPAFDQLGMEGVPAYNIANSVEESATAPIGYNLRYWQWKSCIDVVCGGFSHFASYKSWVAPLTWSNVLGHSNSSTGTYYFNYRAMKVLPQQMNFIFNSQVSPDTATIDTDQLLCNVNFQVYATQNLDRNGLPY
ncbi:major capsid protein [Microvirus mar56]|uniref:Major capsid protein n=1 Tax=Microvirus mar56 TaxID=2851192 RepID=A0A8F5RBW1_9VIRU|nr:major capsid protein [Microvirus mar56]